MTANVHAFPTLMDQLRDAFAIFDQEAAETSSVPVPVMRALRSPDAVTVSITVGGVPVVLQTGRGGVPRSEVVGVWAAMLAAAPPAGSRIRTAGSGVMVCPPDALGGAA